MFSEEIKSTDRRRTRGLTGNVLKHELYWKPMRTRNFFLLDFIPNILGYPTAATAYSSCQLGRLSFCEEYVSRKGSQAGWLITWAPIF